MINLSYGGLKDAGTFEIDTITATAIGKDYANAVNKVVTLKDGKVGYGSKGNFIFGVISKVEPFENGSDILVATINWNNTFENVMLTTTASDNPISGGGIVCSGTGGVSKLTDATIAQPNTGIAIIVNATDKTCTIRLY